MHKVDSMGMEHSVMCVAMAVLIAGGTLLY